MNLLQALSFSFALCPLMGMYPLPAGEQNGESLQKKQQPLFERINLQEAWKITKGDPKILIGVIDNGFDFYHPDLKGQLQPGYYYNGGYHTEAYEVNAHGTLVASIIVARDDGKGMVGLAPACKVLTASQGTLEHKLSQLQREFFKKNPKATLPDWQKEMMKHLPEIQKFGKDWVSYQVRGAAEAIRYLIDHGARVINISGVLKKSLVPDKEGWQMLEDAFEYARKKNIVIVLGAGNSAQEWDDYPGTADNVLIAGASLLNDKRWEEEKEVQGLKIKMGSCYGKRLSVLAPVENIVICVPHEERFYKREDSPVGPTEVPFKGPHEVSPNGATSSAAPIVTSLVALMLSVDPTLDAKTIIQLVQQGADDLGEKGFDIHNGHGRVNFGRTLRLVVERKGK